MAEQLNVRVPKSTSNQMADLIEWTGMTQTQIVIQALDRLHHSYKQESEAEMGFIAYKRSLNAGFASETVSALDGVIVDQFSQTQNAASWVDGLPNRIGAPVSSLKGLGFRRITNQEQVDTLYARLQERSIQE